MLNKSNGTVRANKQQFKILVLDSRADHLAKISSAFTEAGYELVPACSIDEATLALDAGGLIDVVVAEAFLEKESSFDFLSKVREKPGHEDVPVMLIAVEPSNIASYLLPSVEKTAKVLGAYKFLFMPHLDISQLMKEIEAVLPKLRS